MTLRRQLLLASLLLLSLPWAGCQFVREMEGAMRQGQAQALQATARSIATALSAQAQLLYPAPARMLDTRGAGDELYAAPAQGPVILDGYDDGWEGVSPREFVAADRTDPFSVSYRCVTRGDELYLLLRVTDGDVRYHRPSTDLRANGDRLVLRSGSGERYTQYVVLTSAPGDVQVRTLSGRGPGVREHRIRGIWQDSVEGYTLELSLPLADLDGRLGFFVVDSRATGEERFLGNIQPTDRGAPPWLVHFPRQLAVTLERFAGPGLSLQVTDHAQWVIGQARQPQQASDSKAVTFWLLRLLYRRILEPYPSRLSAHHGNAPGQRRTPEVLSALAGSEALAWYRPLAQPEQTVIAAAAPIRYGEQTIGAVLAERSSEQYLSLTDRAVSRLMLYSLLVVGLSLLGLLAFAASLSWRIRSLSKATRQVMRDDGQLLDNFPRSRRNDEIGELSRAYADLLERLRAYHDYLRGLSHKLSHELRTPMAVIQSSLEHIEQPGQAESQVYVARAREGLARLNSILGAMSEATRLEESIRANTMERVDLCALLQDLGQVYRDVYPRHRIQVNCAPGTAPVKAAPELLVQLLDKLLDNATSFAPDDASIDISVDDAGDYWRLDVANPGPPLPERMHGQLFDSMVSVRPAADDRVHLGLGLHIVRLIADYHGAQVNARNLPGASGVCFSVLLPKAGITAPE